MNQGHTCKNEWKGGWIEAYGKQSEDTVSDKLPAAMRLRQPVRMMTAEGDVAAALIEAAVAVR